MATGGNLVVANMYGRSASGARVPVKVGVDGSLAPATAAPPVVVQAPVQRAHFAVPIVLQDWTAYGDDSAAATFGLAADADPSAAPDARQNDADYLAGDRILVNVAGADHVYLCTAPGHSAVALPGAYTGAVGEVVVDGTASFTESGVYPAQGGVTFTIDFSEDAVNAAKSLTQTLALAVGEYDVFVIDPVRVRYVRLSAAPTNVGETVNASWSARKILR